MPLELHTIAPKSAPKDIERWADELHKAALSARHERRLQSELNWSFYLGKQNSRIHQGKVENFWNEAARPYRSENLLRPMVDTQSARTVKDIPDATVKPVTAEAVSRSSAKIA